MISVRTEREKKAKITMLFFRNCPSQDTTTCKISIPETHKQTAFAMGFKISLKLDISKLLKEEEDMLERLLERQTIKKGKRSI